MTKGSLRACAVQAAPAFLDREATLSIVLDRLQGGKEGGADLCVFPETFWSGYPFWVDITDASRFDEARQKEAYAQYLDAAVEVDGPQFREVVAACRDLDLFAYLGVAERSESGGSVYCTLVAIDPERGVVGVHRKLRPTYGERLVWAPGDGNGLRVHDFRGARLGGLNCWENWMPLARASLYAQGEQIHAATWPGAPHLTRDISRFVALEGRVFVISAGAVLRAEHLPHDFALRDEVLAVRDRFTSGGSIIVAPDGEVLAEAEKHAETLLFADLDLARVREERQNFDPAGHYGRPDVLGLRLDRRRLAPLDDSVP